MKNTISYNECLEELIKEKKLIAYELSPNDKLIKNKWYFDSYYQKLIKVINVEYTHGILDHAETKSIEGYKSYITTPLGINDYYIEFDREFLYKKKIININQSFTGAEIRYWFFMNNIDCFNKKYRNFWQYVDTYSSNRLNDKARYFLKAKLNKHGYYYDCAVIKDFTRHIPTAQEIQSANEYMRIQKEKDYHNVKKLHEKKEDSQS